MPASVLLAAALLARPPAGAGTCLRAVRGASAGAVARAADFAPASCLDAGAALAYDRVARIARLTREVAAGEVIRGSRTTLAAVGPGEDLVLRAQVGPVTVERRVQAVRATRVGEAVLVRGADGRVFAAPAPAEAGPL